MRLIAGFLTGTAILLAVATTPLAFVWFLFRNLFSSPIQNKKKAGCEWSVFFVC
jgi:hypothetical protein